MGSGFEGFSELRDDALDYVKLRWASLRLGTVDRLSSAVSKAFGCIATIVLGLFALVFLLIALALWIGDMSGHASLGFLVSGGIFLIAGAVMFFVGRKLFANGVVRYFVDLFFTDNDYKHGMQR